MKKSIFLFFAAILCAMTANAQLYLRGGFNNWNDLTADYQFVSNVCNLELPGGTTYEFKIADSSWGTQFGGNLTFTATATKTLTSGGGNMKITTTIPGTYRFEFVQNTKKLTVTYPELPAPHDITVRAQVPASWTNTITAWVWTSENGAGEEVTPTKDGDYYVVTKNAGALYVIFKNGAGWNGDKNQTVDLCYTEDVCLQLNQSGSAKATATVIECGAVSKDITVKAVVPGAWENTITAWVWPTGGEGKEVTPTKDGNWYVVTENCIELNVIFKNGTGWNGNENQTANITGVSENTCYQISAINKDGEGKCTYTVVDCEAAIEPEAKPVDVYTVVGSDVLLGTAWDLNNADNEMTKQDDGSYVLVKENVDLATTGAYEYKVVKNHDWGWSVPSGNANLTLKLGNEDVDGTYNVTFTLNKELNALTASLELVEAKKVIPECYVAGDESLTGQNWNAKSILMTYDEATEVYTATLTAVPAGTHNMKVVYGGEWLGFDHLATPAPANVKEGEDKKIQFTLAEAGNVTVTYHATNGIGLTGNFAEPVTYDYYIAGTLAGGWSATQQGMEKDGDLYKATFTELNAGTYQFKITDGQFNTEEDKTHEHTTLAAEYKEVSYVDGNIQFVTEEAKNITVIFDATANKITIDGLTIVTHTYTIAGDAALCGEAWNWELEANDMTNNDDGTYTWTKAGVEVNGELSFKVFVDHKSEPAYPTENWVIKPENYEGNGVYDVTITFTESSKEIAVALTKQVVAPTEIDVTLSGMVKTPVSRMGSYRFLSLDDEDGNQLSIMNGSEEAYGEFEVSGYLAEYDVTVVGNGTWEVVDGVETLTATLQVEDDNTTIYNVTATVGVATTITLECMDATYTITDLEFNEVTFTGVADGKEFSILVSYFGGEYYSEGEWGETFIMGTEIEFDDSDAEEYYLGGTYIDDASNTYEVVIFATPAAVEPTPDYTRTVTAGNYGTICLEFGSTNYTGMELYEFVGKEEGKAYLGSVTTLVAGVPYIFRATASELAVYSDGTTAATPGENNGLVGTFTDATEVTVGNYILFNNAICEVTATCWVNANRAYIVWNDIPAGAPQQMPGRKYIGMDVTSENEATGLDNITNGKNTTLKLIENGQLIIIRNGEKFNAQGQKL